MREQFLTKLQLRTELQLRLHQSGEDLPMCAACGTQKTSRKMHYSHSIVGECRTDDSNVRRCKDKCNLGNKFVFGGSCCAKYFGKLPKSS